DDRTAGSAAESAAAAAASAEPARIRQPARELRHPREREVLDVALIDLGQRAVAPARVVTGIREPVVAKRLEDLFRIETALPLRGQSRRGDQAGGQQDVLCPSHLSVTR